MVPKALDHFAHHHRGNKAISGAMCCGVSELGKLMSRFSGNFVLTEKVGALLPGRVLQPLQPPELRPPNNNLTSKLFGHSTQTLASSLGSGGANGGFNPLYQIGGPRSIQLALKLQF